MERARAGRLFLVGSGAALIDTVYLDNAIDALVCAVDRCVTARGQALVVSNGEPRPIAELIGGDLRRRGGARVRPSGAGQARVRGRGWSPKASGRCGR